MKISHIMLLLFLLTLSSAVFSQTALGYMNSGKTKLEKQDYRGAISDFTKAIEIDPKNATAYSMRGGAKGELKDNRGAISDLSKAIEYEPENPTFYLARGSMKIEIEEYSGAISDYNKVIELDPKKALAYLGKGAVKFALKDYIDAITNLTKGLELRPNYPRGYYLRGVAKCELAQNESGCLDLNKARELGYSGADEAINKYCNNLPYKKLYEELHKAEYYTKSEDEFYQQFGTPEGQEKLYKALNEAGYYTKSMDEFKKQFFGGTHFPKRDSLNYKFNSTKTKPKFDPNKPFEVVPDITTDYDPFDPETTADNYGYIGDKGLKGSFQIDKIKVGNSYIELPFPSGFVKVDDSMGNLLEAAKKLCPETNTLLAYYLSEEDYANYLVDENHICEKYILIEVYNELKDIKVGAKDYRQFLKKHKEDYTDEFKLKIDDAEIKASENLSKIDERLKMNDFKMEPFGICYESKYSLSYGILTKYNFTVDYENSGDYIVAGISTITKVDKIPIFLLLYKKYNGSKDIQSLKVLNSIWIEEIDKRQSPGNFLAEIDFEDYKESILAILTLSFIWAIYFATKKIHRKLKNSSEKKVAKVEEKNEFLDFSELLHEDLKIKNELAVAEIIEPKTNVEIPENSFKVIIPETLKVNRRTRFYNWLIDAILFYFIIYLPLFLYNSIINPYLYLLILFLYYFIQELLFRKTIGKFITQTNVINSLGLKPTILQLIIRNASRLIPFEAFTYLSKEKRGLHDIFSKTYVIKDNF